MRGVKVLCLYIFLGFCFSIGAKGQNNVTLDNTQQEVVKVIESVMHLSEQDLAPESKSPTTSQAIETVRAFTGGKEFNQKEAIALASMLTLENNHIVVLPKYREKAKGATWDGVSLFDLAKALDEFRSNDLTLQQ